MTEAFARMHGGSGADAQSAGLRPSGRVNSRAVEYMWEVGYGLTTRASKSLDQFNGWEKWQIPDPKETMPAQYREVRALIERKVKELLATL